MAVSQSHPVAPFALRNRVNITKVHTLAERSWCVLLLKLVGYATKAFALMTLG